MAEAAVRGAAGARVGRPQPQTTGEPGPGNFEQHSKKMSRPAYSVNAGYGQAIDQPLAAAPGYLRYLDLIINANGGANATTVSVAFATTGAGADMGPSGVTTAATSGLGTSPAASVAFIQVKDAYGTPVFTGPGYEMLYLVPFYSGQVGVLAASDLMKWPNVSTAGLGSGTATTVTGNFFFHSRIPFEIVPGYGCLAVGNAALQPQLHIQYAASSAVYTTAPGTAPTLTTTVDESFWGVPVDFPDLEPYGLGTTLQWTFLTANPTVGSASSQRVQFPRTGGYLTTLILVARNSIGNRDDTVWPARGSNNRIRLYIDGVPVLDEMIEERLDQMYLEFGGAAHGSAATPPTGGMPLRPAGVIAYSFKTSLSQVNLGLLDNLDQALSSTPGTLIEVECTPWGSFSNTPATISCVVGQIVPRGRILQGAGVLA